MRPLQTDLGRALGLGLLLGLLLGGCGAKGVMRTFDVSPERTATLTVIRPSIAGFAFRFPVYLDGDHVLGLGAREHATITIPAGVRRVGLPKGYDLVEVEETRNPATTSTLSSTRRRSSTASQFSCRRAGAAS